MEFSESVGTALAQTVSGFEGIISDEATPSTRLAALLVDRLVTSGLLRADKRDALIAKIAAGTMQGEDWKLEIDLAPTKVEVE